VRPWFKCSQMQNVQGYDEEEEEEEEEEEGEEDDAVSQGTTGVALA